MICPCTSHFISKLTVLFSAWTNRDSNPIKPGQCGCPRDVVHVNVGEEAVGEGDGIGGKAGQLAFVRLVLQDLELRGQVNAPHSA